MERGESSVISDILRIISIIFSKWWLISLSTIICGAILLIRALFFMTPLYSSSAMIYVNNSNMSVSDSKITLSSADISASQSLVQTYITILNSRITLENVINEADVDYTVKELREMLSAEAIEDTEVFSVSVCSEDPAEACKIANTIVKILPERISDVVDGTSARIVDTAVTDFLIVSPEYFKHLLFGMLFGFVVMSAYVVTKELLDDKIQSEEWLKTEFKDDIPLLVVIPDEYKGSSRYGKYYYRKRYGQYYQSYVKDTNKEDGEEK